MILWHYSQSVFKYDDNYTYPISCGFGRKKPGGLWLSDDNNYGWKDWCIENEWKPERLSFVTEIQVDLRNVIVLRSVDEIANFTKLYKIVGSHDINWHKVSVEHKGVLISPFQGNLDLDFFWCGNWDCSSACIWELSAIKHVGISQNIQP